jgi:hypothetical protein
MFTAAAALAKRLPSGYRRAIFAKSGPERLSTNQASLENPLCMGTADLISPLSGSALETACMIDVSVPIIASSPL